MREVGMQAMLVRFGLLAVFFGAALLLLHSARCEEPRRSSRLAVGETAAHRLFFGYGLLGGGLLIQMLATCLS